MTEQNETHKIEPKYKGVKHFFAAFRYSLDGFKAAFRHEAAFRQEMFLGVVNFALMFLLPLSLGQRLYFGALWVILVCFELVNSALEAIVDLVSPEWHPLAKRAKDMGSSVVFLMLTLFFTSWACVLVFGQVINK